ncbi:MAG: hypothetical protein K8S99_18170 [Planctomycetes bacterium]|nr:hypothetical protein [Planctomycetota bacterium]
MSRWLPILVLLLAAPLHAEPINTEQVLHDLASEDFNVRRSATHTLLADNRLTVEELAQVYRRATTPEQRNRLVEVARHHFLRREQEALASAGGAGSMGVILTPQMPLEPGERPAPGSVRIAATFPGFPAYVHLEPGDTITALDDQPLDGDAEVQNRFIAAIQSRKAGSELRLTLDRNGQTVKVTMQLAAFMGLKQIFDSTPTMLQGAYYTKWSELRGKYFPDASDDTPLKVDLSTMPRMGTAPPDAQMRGQDELVRRQAIEVAQVKRAETALRVQKMRLHEQAVERAAVEARLRVIREEAARAEAVPAQPQRFIRPQEIKPARVPPPDQAVPDPGEAHDE